MSGVCSSLRVLRSYRHLLRSQRALFRHDLESSVKAATHIRSQYELNRDESDTEKIEQLIKLAIDAKTEIDTSYVQAEEKNGVWAIHVRPTTKKGYLKINSASSQKPPLSPQQNNPEN